MSVIHKIYHSNAVLRDGREGLLVDTGAVFNLTGDLWLQRMKEHVPENMPIHYEELSEPQGVMGVGQHASTATHVAAVPVGMADQGIEPDESFRYKATVITDSDVPALLGLQSMMASNCILDLRPGKMHMYTTEDANALEIKYAPKNILWDASNGQSTIRPPHVTVQPISNFITFTFTEDKSTQFLHTTYPFKITYADCIEPPCHLQKSTDVAREADRAGRPHECRMR